MQGLVGSEAIKSYAVDIGFTTVGICPASTPPHLDAYRDWLAKGFHGEMAYLENHLSMKASPETLLPGAKSIVACTLNYYQPLLHKRGEAKVARYALGRDYHRVIRAKLRRLAQWIEMEHPGSACRPCVDSAPILERDFAQLAGLGFFGKNTMLIDPKRGSWFFLGLMLTTVPFTPDTPFIGSCGTCTKCIDACPTGAIVMRDDHWQVDARNCISYLTIEKSGPIDPALASHLGEWTFGCDVCQEVCPFNEERESQPLRASRSAEKDFAARRVPTLNELITMSGDRFDELSRGSPLRRAGREGLKRNAEINQRNLTISKND